MFKLRKRKTDPALKALRADVELQRAALLHACERIDDANKEMATLLVKMDALKSELASLKESPARKSYEADMRVLAELQRCNHRLGRR
jgi:hypothetical protein